METAVALGDSNIDEETLGLVMVANEMVVGSKKGMEDGREHIRVIKELRKKVKKTFDTIVTKAHEAHKEAVSERSKNLTPLAEAEQIVKGKIGDYMDVLEEERVAEENKRIEKARKDRERLLNKAKKKIEKLLEAKTDINQQISDLQGVIDDPDTTEEEEAIATSHLNILQAKLENKEEQVEDVEVTVDEPVDFKPVVAQKTQGVSGRITLVPVVVNKMALIKFAISNEAFINLVDINESVLKNLVKAGTTLPGVKVTKKRSVVIR